MNTDRWQSGWLRGPGLADPGGTPAESARADLSRLRWLRVAAVAEATTLLILVGVAVPLKHLYGWPLLVRVLGPIHGLTFFAYLWLVLRSLGAGLLSRGGAVRLALAAFVPMAGFFSAHFLSRDAAAHLDQGSR